MFAGDTSPTTPGRTEAGDGTAAATAKFADESAPETATSGLGIGAGWPAAEIPDCESGNKHDCKSARSSRPCPNSQ